MRGCLSHHISVGYTPRWHRAEFKTNFEAKENTKMKAVIDKIIELKGTGLQVLYSNAHTMSNGQIEDDNSRIMMSRHAPPQ